MLTVELLDCGASPAARVRVARKGSREAARTSGGESSDSIAGENDRTAFFFFFNLLSDIVILTFYEKSEHNLTKLSNLIT